MLRLFKSTTALAAALSLVAIPLVRGADHQVIVGGPGVLKYDPEFVTANPGDTITFTFKQKNHTATQSTFQNPCQLADGGFDSGFIPVPDNNTAGPFPAAQFTVKDTNPVWVYCRQANHCQQGMVFAINPADKFAAFQAAAMGLPASSASAASSLASSSIVSSSTAPPPAATTSPSATGIVTVTATITVSGTQQVTTYASYPGSAAPTAVMSTDHKVTIGGPNKLIFDPANITAQVGDTITFTFQQKNHTVTQSNFANPCTSLTQTSTSGQVGFDSGFMPVSDNATSFPSFTIQINDTAPIWAFCKQTAPVSHCAQGMVFSANAVESGPNNFGAFQAKAKASSTNTSSTGGVSPSASTSANANGAVRLGAMSRSAGVAALLGLVMGLL